MLRPQHFILLASLLVDGGTAVPPSASPAPDAGAVSEPVSPAAPDAGAVSAPVSPAAPDAGAAGAPASASAPDAGKPPRKPVIVDGFRWPEDDELRLLTVLDGRAVVAAHAAIQDLRARFAKEDKKYAGHCDYSPTAMDVVVFEGEGTYFIRINRRLDRCGWAHPSLNAGFAPELYAVSPEGRVLARYPYNY